MTRQGGEGFLGLGHLASRFRAAVQRRRGDGIKDQQPILRPVEPETRNEFMQAMVTYLADRQRLRQQGYLHTRYGEPGNISLADAYHNDLTAIAFSATDVDTLSVEEVRKTGNHLRVLDQFELFGIAHFSFPKQVEIIDGWLGRIELNKREGYPQANSKVTYPGNELEVVAMLLKRIGFSFDYPKEGWQLAPSEVEAAWKSVISQWRKPVDQVMKDITKGRL